MAYNFFDKKSGGSGIANEPNYQLENELHKPIITKLRKEKFIHHLETIFWGIDLAAMHTLSKYNKGIKYLLCAIDLLSKYAWVSPLKNKKRTSIVNVFQKIISEGRKPNTMWVDQGSEFYNDPFKYFLKINNIEMYSTYNKGKSVVAERFTIKTLKNKIFNHMIAISKNVYFDVLDDIVSKYNNNVHRTIKMKPIDVTNDFYAEYNEDSNKKDPKFKVGDHVRISKYENIFAKGYTINWSEEVFVVSKIKTTVPQTYVVSDLNGELINGSFYEKEWLKTSQEKFRIEKVLKRKDDNLYVKWKGYDNSFNSWIDE